MADDRPVWTSKVDFVLTTLGYAVGLGNIWRFPFYCGRNGGAAFLVAYVIMMVFAGFPVFYLELCLGQYSGYPPHQLWPKLSPLFGGIGFSMIVISAYISIYYNMVVGWALYYFGSSFYKTLPYASCTNAWNNLTTCFDYVKASECSDQGITYVNATCENVTDPDVVQRITDSFLAANESPSMQFWNNHVLQISAGIDQMGYPNWPLVLTLLAAWIIVCFILTKGIKFMGKSVYFTTTFPYIIVIILIVRGCTLTGAHKGIEFYLIPDFTRLKESGVWLDAAVQIFFSLGVGLGGLSTLGSYNPFHNNALRDTIIVVLGNCITSFIAGFAIFSVLGHLASESGREVAELATEGPGLAFVAYPQATSQIPLPQLWGVLFFLVLILLGVNTEQVNVEVVVTAIVDTWPALRHGYRRTVVTIAVCAVFFIIGLCLTTPGGAYVLNLIDKFASGWPVAVVALFECCVVAWVYGIRRFMQNIGTMLGTPPNWFWAVLGYPVNAYWGLTWIVITPALLLFILIFSWVKYTPVSYDTYVYPEYAQGLGWLIAVSCVAPIVLVALYQAHTYTRNLVRFLPANLINPTSEWGPNDDDAKAAYKQGINYGPLRDYQELRRSFQGSIYDRPVRKLSKIYVVEDGLNDAYSRL